MSDLDVDDSNMDDLSAPDDSDNADTCVKGKDIQGDVAFRIQSDQGKKYERLLQDKLNKEPFLAKKESSPSSSHYQLAYHPGYNILYCQNDTYVMVVPLDYLYLHLIPGGFTKYPNPKECQEHHYHVTKATMKMYAKEVQEAIPNVLVTSVEVHTLKPHLNQQGPIAGLKPFVTVLVCILCGEDKSVKRSFEIPATREISEDSDHRVEEEDDDELVATKLFYQQYEEQIGPSSESALSSDSLDDQAILSFFCHIGADKHVNEHLYYTLVALVALPSRNELPLIKQHQANLQRFIAKCAKITIGNSVLRTRIMNSNLCM
ncbi:hypothetical protein BKA93DRAFT_752748 [Sparassis latifolia]